VPHSSSPTSSTATELAEKTSLSVLRASEPGCTAAVRP
jgi:hypothetical protein